MNMTGKNEICSGEEYETFWEKEEMLVTSFFSFSHNDFKSPMFEVCLTHSHTMAPFDAPGKQAF